MEVNVVVMEVLVVVIIEVARISQYKITCTQSKKALTIIRVLKLR